MDSGITLILTFWMIAPRKKVDFQSDSTQVTVDCQTA